MYAGVKVCLATKLLSPGMFGWLHSGYGIDKQYMERWQADTPALPPVTLLQSLPALRLFFVKKLPD